MPMPTMMLRILYTSPTCPFLAYIPLSLSYQCACPYFRGVVHSSKLCHSKWAITDKFKLTSLLLQLYHIWWITQKDQVQKHAHLSMTRKKYFIAVPDASLFICIHLCLGWKIACGLISLWYQYPYYWFPSNWWIIIGLCLASYHLLGQMVELVLCWLMWLCFIPLKVKNNLSTEAV